MSTATAISQQLAEQKTSAAEQYRHLVVAAGGGTLPSMDTVRDLSSAAGRSVDDFIDDVRDAEQRLKLKERMGDIDDLTKKLRSARHEWERRDLHGCIEKARDARRQLIATCRDAEKLAQHKRLRELQEHLRQELHDAEKALGSWRGQLAYARRELNSAGPGQRFRQEQVDGLVRYVEKAEQKVDGIEARRVEAAAEFAAIQDAMAEV